MVGMDAPFSLRIETVEWPGRAGAVVVTGPVTGRFPRIPDQRLMVRSSTSQRDVRRAWIESNRRNSELRVHLWGVSRSEIAAGMTLVQRGDGGG
jgi:hypothetical protein